MSDSGSTSFPARPLPAGQATNSSSTSSEPNARILGVPNEVRAELQTRRASLRLQGEVVRHNDDGSIRVRTERGDVDVRLRDGQEPPPKGTRVEVELQPPHHAERPPEAATVREVPPETPAPRPSATPVNVEVRPQDGYQPLPADQRHAPNANERNADAPRQPQPLPPEGSVVRLQPLPPRVAQTLPFPTPEILPQVVSTITAPITFEAEIISQQAVSDLQQAAAQIQTPPAAPDVVTQPVIANTPEVSVPNVPAAQTAPVILQPSVTAAAIDTPPVLPAPQEAQPVVINTENFTPNIRPENFTQARLIQSAITNTPVLTVVAETLPPTQTTNVAAQTPPIPIPLKPLALDGVIERITPPPVVFIPPNVSADIKAEALPPIPATENIAAQAGGEIKNIIVQNQKAASVTGVVTNVTNDSLPVLTVFFPQLGGEQIFALQFPTENIAIGTQIQITPQAVSVSPTAVNVTAAQTVPLPVLLAPQPWPTMDDVLQTLARAALPTAQAMVNVTPSPANPAQMGPAMMFFIAALRGGDLQQWLGQKAGDILKTQKGGNALSRLLGESTTLARVASEPLPQDWRAVNIPLFWEGDMNKIALYYKHEREDDSDEDSGLKSTRFVFDLALDQMGKVQLDGLFRPATGQLGRLDLVVRTEEHFAQSTQAEMRRIYAKALRDTQVTGELSFQNQRESWVTIQADHKNVLGVNA